MYPTKFVSTKIIQNARKKADRAANITNDEIKTKGLLQRSNSDTITKDNDKTVMLLQAVRKALA
tara:strand:- start:1549 stop:1740 length:192 start_codon:yes stop_codon:yes gene_type:complete